jgi:hypothetical protein
MYSSSIPSEKLGFSTSPNVLRAGVSVGVIFAKAKKIMKEIIKIKVYSYGFCTKKIWTL